MVLYLGDWRTVLGEYDFTFSGRVPILHLRDTILTGVKSRAVYLSRMWRAIWLDDMDAVKSQKR